MVALAGFVAAVIVAVGVISLFALLSGRNFGSGFATAALVVFVISILSGQWIIAIGTLIGVPIAIAVGLGFNSLRERSKAAASVGASDRRAELLVEVLHR